MKFPALLGVLALTFASVRGEWLCNVCLGVVREADELAEVAESELVVLAKTYCTKELGDGIAGTACQVVMAELIPDVISLLEKEMTPEFVCQKVKACKAGKTLFLDLALQQEESVLDQMCDVCKNVVGQIEAEIQDPELQKKLDAMCNKLGPLADKCVQAVNGALDKLREFIKQPGMTPTAVCGKVHLCQASMLADHGPPAQMNGIMDKICPVCKEVVQKVEDEVTSDELRKALDQLCQKVGPLSEMCLKTINEALDEIKELVKKPGMTPEAICGKVHLCPASMLADHGPPAQLNGIMDKICPICKEVVQKVEDKITSDELRQTLDQLCQKVGPLSEMCLKAINEALDEIKELVKKPGMTPEAICGKVHLCPASMLTDHGPPAQLNGIMDKICPICKEVVQKVEDKVTSDELRQALDQLCQRVGPLSEMCLKAINEALDEIKELVKKPEMTPDSICSKVHLCPASMFYEPAPAADANGILDKICPICKDVVQKVEEKVTSDQLRHILHELCSRMGPLSDMCLKKINETLAEIRKLVHKPGMTPEAICGKVHLCPASMLADHGPPAQLNGIMDKICPICKDVVQKIEEKVTSDQLRHILHELCSRMGPLSDMCLKKINETLAEIRKLVHKPGMTPEAICTTVHLCPAIFLQANKASGPFCEVCEKAINELKEYLSNDTRAQLKKVAVGVCSKILPFLKDKCEEAVGDYFDQAFDALLKLIKTDNICHQMKLCTLDAKLGAIGFTGLTQDIDWDKIGCNFCHVMLDFISDNLLGTQILDELEFQMKTICNMIPDKVYAKQCSTLVVTYSTQIFHTLKTLIEPSSLCPVMQLCNGNSTINDVFQMNKIDWKKVECAFCEMLFGFIEDDLISSEVEQTIIDEIDLVCKAIPNVDYSQKCSRMVLQYGTLMIGSLKNLIDPDYLCPVLTMCPTKPLKMAFSAQKRQSGIDWYKVLCNLCTSIFDFISDNFLSGQVKDYVIEKLTAVCEQIPDQTYAAQCKTIVTTYGNTVTATLKVLIEPDKICPAIKMCKTTSQYELFMQTALAKRIDWPKVECDFCKDIFGFIDDNLLSEQIYKTIVADIKKVCAVVPNVDYQKKCMQMIDNYGHTILAYLKNLIAPSTVCPKLNMCPS